MKLAKAGDMEAFDKSPDMFGFVRSSEPLKKEIEGMTFRIADEKSRMLDASQIKSIQVDPKNANTPFKSPMVEDVTNSYLQDPRIPRNSLGIAPTKMMSPDESTKDLVNHLNASFRIVSRYKTPLEALTYVDDVYSYVLGARVDQAAGLTPKIKEDQAKAEAAAAAKPKKKPAPPPTKLTKGVHYDDQAGQYIQVDGEGNIKTINPFDEFGHPKR